MCTISPATHLYATVRRTLTCVFSLWFAFASTINTVANAQADGSDFEAPIIEHEEVESAMLGDIESFVAAVVDNENLQGVSLFYRYAGETEFIEKVMQPVAASSYFTTTVDTGVRSSRATAIEYYIRAEDAAGNIVLKGFAFEPLVRSLVPTSPATSEEVLATREQAPARDSQPPQKKLNWLYVGLGVLLLGGIAAGASGGGSDGVSEGSGTGECVSNCQVTLTLAIP